jgi:hypothetical protein
MKTYSFLGREFGRKLHMFRRDPSTYDGSTSILQDSVNSTTLQGVTSHKTLIFKTSPSQNSFQKIRK